jgi:nitroreductase/ubiquinone/menaquinone biosynthesis C-methylase UbiE
MGIPDATALNIHPLMAQRWSPRAYDPDYELSDLALANLLEAARWSPSFHNSQPWRFIVGRHGDEVYARLFDCVWDTNRQWAFASAALICGLTTLRDDNGAELPTARFDTGQAVAHLTLQAQAEGLYSRQMAGFDADAVRHAFELPDGYEPCVVIAVGALGNAQSLPEKWRHREGVGRMRRSLNELLLCPTPPIGGEPDRVPLARKDMSMAASGSASAPTYSAQDYQRFQLIANGPALFNAVVAACEFDLFGYIDEHPGADFQAIHEHAGIPGHKLRVLLLCLCAADLMTRRDGGYENTPIARELLAGRGPESWRHIFLSRHRTDYAGLAYAGSALRSGTNTGLVVHPGEGPTLYHRLAGDPEVEAILHASIAAFTHQTVPALLDHPELATVRHLLDVGGGSGTVVAGFLERYPEAEATVFDLPSVVGLAHEKLAPELRDRAHFRGGDLFEDAFPAGADAIVMSHLLDVFDEKPILALLGKAYAALEPGGRLFVYSFNTSDDETGGVLAAQLSLYLNVLATGEGMAYPAKDYEAWLRQVGFGDVRHYPDLPLEHGLLVATKD